VEQGKYLYLTVCTGDALAVELEDTAMAWTVIVVIVTHPRSQYHHFPKEAFRVAHTFVRYCTVPHDRLRAEFSYLSHPPREAWVVLSLES